MHNLQYIIVFFFLTMSGINVLQPFLAKYLDIFSNSISLFLNLSDIFDGLANTNKSQTNLLKLNLQSVLKPRMTIQIPNDLIYTPSWFLSVYPMLNGALVKTLQINSNKRKRKQNVSKNSDHVKRIKTYLPLKENVQLQQFKSYTHARDNRCTISKINLQSIVSVVTTCSCFLEEISSNCLQSILYCPKLQDLLTIQSEVEQISCPKIILWDILIPIK